MSSGQSPTDATAGVVVEPATERAVGSRPPKWGVHLLLDDGTRQWPPQVWNEHLAYARRLVGPGGYVVELIRANDLEVEKWQDFLDGAASHELTPVLRLATWPEPGRGIWAAPPRDENGQTYREIAAKLAGFVAALRSPGPLYVLVGNEPNRGDEWGGRADPAEYAQYLTEVSAALHAAVPGRVLVLNGGLDLYAPDTRGEVLNGLQSYDAGDFLDGMQAANPRVWDAIDLWGSHAYPLGPFSAHPGARAYQVDDLAAGEPRTRTPPWPGLYNRGLNAYRWELYKLSSYGVSRRLDVLVTETGWRHVESQVPSIDWVGALIDGEQAAAFIRLAFDGEPLAAHQEYAWTPWSMDADVRAAVLFALDGHPAYWGHTNLLDIGPSGEVLRLKPAFAGLGKP